MNTKILKKMAQAGRNGDTQLVHMRPDEVQGLGLLSQVTGNQMTTNPQTGLQEAWSLPSWVLPAAAIAATVFTGGAAAPLAAGALGAGGAAAAGTAAAAGGAALGAGAGTALGAGAGTALGAGAGTALGTGALTAAVPVAAGGAVAGTGATQAGLLAAQEAGLGASSLGWGGATTGTQGLLNSTLGSSGGAKVGGLLGNGVEAFDMANKVAKPIGTAMDTANMFTPPPKQEMPIATPPMMPQAPQTGPQGLAQLAGQNQQMGLLQQQKDMERKMAQRNRIKSIGGYA